MVELLLRFGITEFQEMDPNWNTYKKSYTYYHDGEMHEEPNNCMSITKATWLVIVNGEEISLCTEITDEDKLEEILSYVSEKEEEKKKEKKARKHAVINTKLKRLEGREITDIRSLKATFTEFVSIFELKKAMAYFKNIQDLQLDDDIPLRIHIEMGEEKADMYVIDDLFQLEALVMSGEYD